MIEIIKGNIFTSNAQTIVNTINCVGVMGVGIAFEFRLRYPEMYVKYVELCKVNQLKIGTLWLYKSSNKWVLNFPTKIDWKHESRIEYLEKGLDKFVSTYKSKGIESIAFPLLGASNGGIPEEISLDIMNHYLSNCDIKIEIYKYDSSANDDLFDKFKNLVIALPEKHIAEISGLQISKIRCIKSALDDHSIKNMGKLLTVDGIGEISLSKAFTFVMNYRPETNLFNNI